MAFPQYSTLDLVFILYETFENISVHRLIDCRPALL